MAEETPSFTSSSILLCYYCKNLVRTEGKDSFIAGCGLVQNQEGQYARLAGADEVKRVRARGGNAFNVYLGCEKFEPSGLPIHPSLIEELIEKNERAKLIPVDPNATETSYEFGEKVTRFSTHEIDLWIEKEYGKFTIRSIE